MVACISSADLPWRSRAAWVVAEGITGGMGRADSGIGLDQAVLKMKLIERERTMSTGIGNGVGVPHTLVEGVQGLHAFVLTLQDPIPFDSVDRKPVVVVIGLFGDPERPNLSLGALATLGRVLRDESFIDSLWKARDSEDVFRLFEDKELKKDA